MSSWKIGVLAALALPVCLSAAEYDNTQQKTFSLAQSGEHRLVIDNITGDIRVTTGSANEIRISAKEHYSAESDAALAKIRNEVRLEMVQSGSEVKVTLEGPFRDRDRESWRRRNDEEREMWRNAKFRHDFEVVVPRQIALELKTVNGSVIDVTGTSGEFNIHNINGKIRMNDVAGYGQIRTVNGAVKVEFRENPTKPVSFSSVNGEFDTTFQPNLNADIRVSTMNGDVYTDFDVQPVTIPVRGEAAKEGGHRFRIGRDRAIRIGSGGVEHSFKTLNGSIKIRKGGK